MQRAPESGRSAGGLSPCHAGKHVGSPRGSTIGDGGGPKNILQLEKGQGDPQNVAAALPQHPPFKGWGYKTRGPNASEVPEEGPHQDLGAVPCCGTPLAPQTLAPTLPKRAHPPWVSDADPVPSPVNPLGHPSPVPSPSRRHRPAPRYRPNALLRVCFGNNAAALCSQLEFIAKKKKDLRKK